ncbi:helix-turn-helix domain-containing protein [Wangella sp. NEAU-J3]|nr:AlkA N-terminal domain-containing protein [Jidongwangia harbinensis]MCA2218662.1 helix-turn-helix domain-containing protein [Jidongwangia harbinensis]
MELDFERCYRAVDSRDQRFDGWFYTAVRTTGIYCRPSCPAVTPKRANVTFYPSSAAAQRNGFRACRRCRPDAAPGSPDWDVRADVVGRAMRLIADGVVDREGVPGLASRLGYTERHLHRMLTAELGAGPLALARAQRAQTARILIETTDLGLAEIAFAAGFGSVRQFNDTILEVYAATPGALRERRPATRTGAGTIHLRLAFRAPLHAPALLEFLAARALPGVEEADHVRYRRALALPHGPATVELRPEERWVSATLHLDDVRDLAPAVARCRRLLDLDADPAAVDAALAADPALTAVIGKEPGVRVPRAVDGFEMAVRAIVGQQVSVASARTTLSRLIRAAAPTYAAPTHAAPTHAAPTHAAPTQAAHTGARDADAGRPAACDADAGRPAARDAGAGRPAARDPGRAAPPLVPFPAASEIAGLPDEAFGMPAARRETIRALAQAVAAGKLDLDPGADRDETVARLQELPGVGAWTAGYVAMRAIGDPDVFLPTDLAVRRGAAALGLPGSPIELDRHAASWRPWRSYALVRLWRAA